MAERHFADHVTTETLEEVRIEIHDSSFGGTATKLKGTGSGWASRSVQQLDVREPLSNPIQKSEVSATLWLKSSSLIDDLFSSEEGRFTLIYEKDSTEYFEGEILPDLCDYEYLEDNALWKLTVKAKDLSSLEGEDYSMTTGRVTIIEAIADILPFSKTIKTHTSWIVDGETAANDYLRQVYLDKFALRTYARTGDETDEPITKLEALNWILKANGLVLKQENGWVLDHITAMSDPTDVLESNYDSSGTFVSASNVGLTNTAKITLASKYNHNPGIKSARLKYDHRTSVTNIQFPSRLELNDTDPTSESFSQAFISDGNQQIKLKATVGAITSESPTSSTFSFSMIIDTGTTVYRYRYSDNSWVTGGAVNNVDMLEAVTNSWTGSINITTPDIPSGADGPLTITLNSATDSDGFADETVWDNIFFDIVNAVAEENSTYIDYQLTQTGDQSVRVKYGDVNFGDGPTGYSRGAFTTDSGGANLTLDDWASRDNLPSPTYINHAHILLREVLDVQRKSRTRISATVKSALSFGDVIAYDGSNYYVLGGSFDGYTGVSSVELLEIDIATGSDTFEKIPKFVADEATGSASTGGSGGATGVTLTEADARYLQQANNLSDLDSASTARTNLGVAIGSDVQAHDDQLDTLSGLSSGQANAIVGVSAGLYNQLGDLSVNELSILDGATLTTTELNYVDGVTSAIQTQLNNKQPLDSELTTLSGMTSAQATGLVGTSGTATFNAMEAGSLSAGGVTTVTSGNDTPLRVVSLDATSGILISDSDDTVTLNYVGSTNLLSINSNLFVEQDTTIDQDLYVGRNAYVEGGLFAKEFIVDQTRVMFDYRMSVGGGKVSTVGGSAGSEVITFEDEEGNEFVPVGEDDIIRIQQRTGFNSGAIVKSLYRRVLSISGNDVTLTTSGIDWTTGDDVFPPSLTIPIEVGDNAVVEGNTDDEDRDQFIEFDVSGQAQPSIRIKDSVSDVGVFDEVATFGYLNGVETDSFGTLGDESGVYIRSGYIDGDVDINGNLSVNSLPRVSDEGLVGLWRFDGSGVDATGGSDASVQSIASYESGISKQGLYGETTSSDSELATITPTTDIEFDSGTPFSISVWMNPEEPATGIERCCVVGKGQNQRSVGIFYRNDNEVIIAGMRTDNIIRQVVYPAPHGELVHVLLTFSGVFVGEPDEGRRLKLYVNGELVDSIDNVSSEPFDNADDWEIGSRKVLSGTSGNWKGLIDEVFIFNRELTAKDAKSLYLYPSGNSGGLISADTIVATEGFFNELTSFDVTIGDGGSISGTNWIIDEEKWVHPTLGGPLTVATKQLAYGTVTSDIDDFTEEWDTPASTTTINLTTSDAIVRRYKYRHQFGMKKLILSGFAKRTIVSFAGTVHQAEIRLIVNGTSVATTIPNSTYAQFTELEVDVSGLTVGTLYNVGVQTYAEVTSNGSDLAETRTFLREDFVVESSTES